MARGEVSLRRQSKAGPFPDTAALSPGQLISQKLLEEALMAMAGRLATLGDRLQEHRAAKGFYVTYVRQET
jgi:hypothetical protein